MSWLRTNRCWLPLLPLVLVGLIAASSYRVKGLWYDAGLHHVEASARPGAFVEVTDHYEDAYGATSRTFRVRAARIGTASTLPPSATQLDPTAPPRGTEVLVAHLDWRADPDQSLTHCVVALVDSRGARYEVPPDTSQTDLCVPARHEGPEVAFTRAQPRGYVEQGDARPASWSTAVSFLAPQGTRITRVLVWWDKPDYVALDVAAS